MLFAFASCTPEDECGTVTSKDIRAEGFMVWINNNRHYVDVETYTDAEVGQYLCIEYDN